VNESLFTKRPAVRLVLFLVLGILSANAVSVHSWLVLAFLAPVFGMSVILSLGKKESLRSDLLLMVLVILIGFYLQSKRKESAVITKVDPFESEPVWIAGTIESEPVRQEKKATFVLRTEILKQTDRVDLKQRRILATLRGLNARSDLSILRCGSSIVGRATVEPFPFQRNPGEFDYGRYLTLNDIQGVATIAAREDFVVTKESAFTGFNAFVGSMQRTLYGLIDHYYLPEQASFLKGVILGYRADLSNEIKQSFMNTGTIHILAVSGSNVAVIVLIMYSMFGFLRMPKKLVGGATIIGVVIFMLITGASPSVVRATIMAIVLLVGTMLERKTDIYNSLSVAAAIILLWDTNALFDVGFQLSFAAVVSIVYIYPILAKLINLIPERFEEIKAIDYVLKLFAVSLAAQMGTLPFTAYYFGRVSIVALLANLIVVPLSGLNVLLGVATVALSVVSPFVASCYAALNNIAVTFLLGFVKMAGNVPYAYAETARFEPFLALLYYGLVAVVLHLTNPIVVKRGLVVFLCLLVIHFGKGILQPRSGILKVTLIDVGQGDAILIESPNHKNMLIDAGPRQFKYDAGERTIVPLLKHKGITKLDCILVTHSHSDHVGGVRYIIEHEPVLSFAEADVNASSALYRETKYAIRRHEISYLDVQRGDLIDLDPCMRVYVLHPRMPEDLHNSLNNTSVVVKLVFGKRSVLLVGDAENEVEAKLCPRYGSFLASDILKVGHHGSNTSSSEEFLRYVKPIVSLVSVGTKNKFGHPSRATIARLSDHASRVCRTDYEGAFVFESDGSSWWEDNWRNGEKDMLNVDGDG